MPTVNKALENLTEDEIHAISREYLMGYRDLLPKHGFRLKGLNRKRQESGLPELTTAMSDEYRLTYIREHYSDEYVENAIEKYLAGHLMSDARYNDGIELFDCRFGPEYARLFKALIGSKAYRKISEKCRVQKLSETQTQRYGGVGLGGSITKSKAGKTASDSKRKFLKAAVKELEEHHCILNSFANSSIFEVFAYAELLKHFSEDDILIDYGVHPYDKRYPFVCDFYIKSVDLFIELNVHFSHGGHWFDAESKSDVNRQTQLQQTDRHRNRKFLDTWCHRDVGKRVKAREESLNYLVFWDGTTHHQGNVLIPNLRDFYMWTNEYGCDFRRFAKDHPENTY